MMKLEIDHQLENVLNRMKQRKGQVEYLVSEIFLTVDQPAQEQEVRRTAQRLVDELRRGAQFPSVARQFSQTASASVGGDLGWIQETTMSDEFQKIISSMKKGDIVGPVATLGGIQILCIGVIGEYIGKIYKEAKARPRYIIEKSFNL